MKKPDDLVLGDRIYAAGRTHTVTGVLVDGIEVTVHTNVTDRTDAYPLRYDLRDRVEVQR